MACLTLLGKMSSITTANSCCIKTWQSWDFKLTNFRSFSCTRIFQLKSIPVAIWHCADTDKSLSSHFLTKYDMLEASIFSYHQTLDVTSLVYPSQLDLDEYSNHPWMLRSMLMTLSYTFFFTCITSIQCLTSRSDQYRRSNNIDLFFQMQVVLFSFFWVLANIVLIS